ncbi:MAG: polysaccharide biosynthesis/export family protein, partial [Pseudomonadota bacterium]
MLMSAGAGALFLTGCATARSLPGAELVGLGEPEPARPFANIPYAQWTDYEPPYRLYPGDELEVAVPSAPELSKTVTVQPDGRITLPLIPPVMAADRTALQVEAALSQAYAAHLVRPEVFVTAKAAPLKIFVGGEVGTPGIYDMA